MRVFERAMYCLNMSLALWYELSHDKEPLLRSSINFMLIMGICLTSIMGGYKEGIRPSQWICLCLFLLLNVFLFADYYSVYAFLALFLGHLAIIMNCIIYGEGTLSKIKLVGPYEVGHKDFHLKHSGIAGSCYYPMDKTEYMANIGLPGRNTRWLRYEDNSLLGVARATADIGKSDHLPSWVFKHLKQVKMYTC